MEQPSNSSKKPTVSIFGLFSAADKFDHLLMFLGLVGSCAHGAVFPVFFILFGNMIDSLGHLGSDTHQMSSQVSKYSLDLVYLGLGVFVAGWIGVACWMQTGERQTARLRLKYLQSVLRKDMNFFDMEARDSNILFHISSDAILVQDAIGDKTGHAVRYLSRFSIGFVVGFKSGEAAYAEAGKVADEVISQIRTVYSFVGEEKAIEEYSNSLKKALNMGKKSGIAKGVVKRGDTNGAKAFTVIIKSSFSGFALGQAAPNIAAISKGRAAAASILSMIETDSNRSTNLEDGIAMPKVSGQIEFPRVCFSYPSRNNMVFENLSFSISAGKTFAFVGPSGSGKSTVISMVQRFYEPASGKILLDGHDLKTLELKWLRQQMGLVSQEPALFAATIADNILFGKEDASMDQIFEAAKAAMYILLLYSYLKVGEGGTQLSGGQKQRIAIARAVLRNPKILLLDEATSALDAESELIVQQALEKIMENRTTIVVAHRLSTIRDVDTIIVLKNGQVVESGNHSELISKGGEYASMASLQVSEHVTDASSKLSGTAGKSSFRELPSSQNEEVTTREMKSKDDDLSRQLSPNSGN
uniref:ABC transporter domain-containing protein n=1 Tax=Salix viminalis TaxID=40686 RepID=A0A6N2L3W8_SALVM